MKGKLPSQKHIRELCAESGPEDGIDPRETLRQVARAKGGRKTQQLCGQVAEALRAYPRMAFPEKGKTG